MILATPYGDRATRSFEGTDFIPPPGTAASILGGAQSRNANDLAVTSVANAVRLVSETIASFVMRVYEGDGAERRPVMNDPIGRLFQNPSEDGSSFTLWEDVVTSLELERHAFIWKVRDRRRREVLELIPMDPALFRVKRASPTSPTIIEARVNGKIQDVTTDVIHIRAWAMVAGVDGVSTLQLHRNVFKTARSYDEYRGRYFDQDAAPGIVLEHPGRLTLPQRRELLGAWVRRHGGTRNAGRPGLVWGGVKVTRFTPTMRDNQAAEISEAITREVAQAFRIYPGELIGAKGSARLPNTAELVSDLFMRFSLLGRIRRIERGVSADRDLFPIVAKRRYSRFDASEFLRADYQTTAAVVHELIQVGAICPDEGRALLGFGPMPNGEGQKFNWPPVGGTSPAKGGNAGAAEPDDDEGDTQPSTDTQEE